jgi:transposase
MLIAFRQELVGRRVACQNRIRALFAGVGLPTPRGHRAWTAAGLAGIEQQAQPLAEVLLETTPGLGRRTAEAVAAHLGDPHRFAGAKQVGAYAGLVPREYQSGTTDRNGKITRRGPGVLRKLLVECAWCMLRYNPWARAVYGRLTARGTSRKKPAVVALARKLLVRCWAMLRTGTAWRSEAVPAGK